MARSHHRKKHKSHLRQFRQSHDTSVSPGAKGKATPVFTIGAALVGLAVCYFASGSLLWMIAGAIVGGGIGYFAGSRMDRE